MLDFLVVIISCIEEIQLHYQLVTYDGTCLRAIVLSEGDAICVPGKSTTMTENRGVFMLQMNTLLWPEPFRLSVKNLGFCANLADFRM